MLSKGGEEMRIAVVDQNEKIIIPGNNSMVFVKADQTLEELKSDYTSAGFDGVLSIGKLQKDRIPKVDYYSDKLLGVSNKAYIESRLKKQITKYKIEELGWKPDDFKKVKGLSVNIKERSSEAGDEDEDIASTATATGVGFAMGMLMYFVIFIYGSMVMRSVMEEKTNRIVEVILSSVRPFQLMMGKIMGVGAVGVTQFAIWAFVFLGINIFASLFLAGMVDPGSTGMAMEASSADSQEIMEMVESMTEQISQLPLGMITLAFFFYFITGYFVYAALFAGLASAVNDESDAQILTIPVGIPVLLSLFILIGMMENPNTSLAFWASICPLSAPIIMPARMAFGVPLWELLLSMVLMILGVVFFVWLAARIYRVGILMYGKKVTFREIAKWMLRS